MKKVLLLFVCSLLTAPSFAQQPDKKGEPPRPLSEAREEAQPLPRPVKLSFRFEPEDGQFKPLWVLVSTTRYSVDVSYQSKDGEFQLRVEGHVRPLEGKFLVTYNAQVFFTNADVTAMFKTDGSTQLTPGKEKKLATLGDRSLMLVLDYDDAEKKSEK